MVSTEKQTIASIIPQPGELAEVRRRQWVVNKVDASGLHNGISNKQHFVSLESLDEDSLGQTLDVVWELEPGAHVIERAGLPSISGVDNPDILDAFLDAVRWGAATSADRSFLQSPFRSGISIEDYQLDPLVRAIDMARVNLMIADDVGLGKTIEAGLVIQELLLRHRAKSILIVCPASLQVKWQMEMLEKFGLEFRIVDTDHIRYLRRQRGIHANPWIAFPRLITSMDWMKSGEGLRLFQDIIPINNNYPRKFDILVVDEAHNISPAAATIYSLESQRTRLIRAISPHFSHKLFLSATPHNGNQESFTALLELLDDQRFARTIMPNGKQLRRVMVRRMKSDIVDNEGKSVFPERKLECLEIDYSPGEKSIHDLLGKFTKVRSSRNKESGHTVGHHFVHTLLKKRLFSSPAAFASTLIKHTETIKRGRKVSKHKQLDERILRKAILKSEEEYADDRKAEEAQLEAVELATQMTRPLDDGEEILLKKLLEWADIHKNKVDSKAQAVLDWLEAHLKSNGKWNDKRVILFTEYRSTHTWMHQILSTHGFGGDRMMVIHGGVLHDDREIIKAAFQANPDDSKVRILLATDAASEGIDLQNHCNFMIHLEIPWNPNVLEQRNGRIDRHGQKQKAVHIWHPVTKGFDPRTIVGYKKLGDIEGDNEYLMRAVLKVEQIRQDLGSVGPVIARQIEEGMLGKRSRLDTKTAELKASKARKLIGAEKKLQEKIARLHERLLEARTDLRIHPEFIQKSVETALTLAKMPSLKAVNMKDVPAGKVFQVPVLPGTWGRATSGLEHPHNHVRRPITFDHEIAKGRDDLVLAHLNHKLVQMCLRLLREEIWKLDDVKLLHRVTIKVLPDSKVKVPLAAVWSRLVVTGGDYNRLHEELTLSGGEIDSKGYRRMAQVKKLNDFMSEAEAVEVPEDVFQILKGRFERNIGPIQRSVDARSKDRLASLEVTLSNRERSEINDQMTVLDELATGIQKELDDETLPKQLTLPGIAVSEQNEIRRDISYLQDRLERIPQEKMQEKKTIKRRYVNPTIHSFPVAVIFLVPRSLLKVKE
jgi:ERCC4-related helicase